LAQKKTYEATIEGLKRCRLTASIQYLLLRYPATDTHSNIMADSNAIQGFDMAARIGAEQYVECYVLKATGIVKVFECAANCSSATTADSFQTSKKAV